MSRKRNQSFKGVPNELDVKPVPQVVSSPIEPPEVKPRAFQPRACVMCTALREPNSNYSKVTHTIRQGETTVRYCKCRYCGFTWRQEASA